MAQQVKKKEEKEQLENIPLIELLRLAAGDSQKEEQDKVCFQSSGWLLIIKSFIINDPSYNCVTITF